MCDVNDIYIGNIFCQCTIFIYINIVVCKKRNKKTFCKWGVRGSPIYERRFLFNFFSATKKINFRKVELI